MPLDLTGEEAAAPRQAFAARDPRCPLPAVAAARSAQGDIGENRTASASARALAAASARHGADARSGTAETVNSTIK
jgi:hypothetical protein